MTRAFGIAALLALAGCGARPTEKCGAITDACTCFARSDCSMVKETCWCAAECGVQGVACLECTATKFIRCEDKK